MARGIKDNLYDKRQEEEYKKSQYYKPCPNCKWKVSTFNRYLRNVCPRCGTMVYYKKEDEFKNKLKGMLKK